MICQIDNATSEVPSFLSPILKTASKLNSSVSTYLARVVKRECFNVALCSAFLTLCNDYASKKRFFVTVGCAAITFLFKICIHINRYVALCLCNGSIHISLSARLLKNSFVELLHTVA